MVISTEKKSLKLFMFFKSLTHKSTNYYKETKSHNWLSRFQK